MELRLVLRQTCGRHVHGVYDIYDSGQLGANVERFFFYRLQICIQLLLEVYPTGRLCYKYKYSASCQLTYCRKFYWNSLTVIDFNSQQTKLLSQNATFDFFFDPVGSHFWK